MIASWRKVRFCAAFLLVGQGMTVAKKDLYVNGESGFQNYITVFEDQPHEDPEKPSQYVNLQAPQGGKITFGAVGSFDTIYSFFIKGDPAAGLSLLHATLGKSKGEETSVAYPYVAECVKIRADRVTFTLRENLTFHDGTPITPADVIFSFRFITRHSPTYRQYYQMVDHVKQNGPCNVTFFLKKGAAKESALILSQLPVLSEKFFTTHDVQKKPLTFPVGSGPYCVVEVKPGRFIRYEKVKNWWGKDLPINQGCYNFQFITYEYFRDQAVFFEAFKKGEVDVFLEHIAKNWEKGYDFPALVEGRVRREEWTYTGPASSAFLYNCRNPLFQDRVVRKALAILLPFEEMNRNLFFGSYKRITSLFQNMPTQATGLPSPKEMEVLQTLKDLPPEVMIQTAEDLTLLPEESDRDKKKKALNLLAQAGWRLHNGVLTHPEKGVFQFTMTTSFSAYEKVLQRMKTVFASIGITMDIQIMDPVRLQNKLSSFDFDMTPKGLTSSALPGNELLAYFSSSSVNEPGGSNLVGVRDTTIDALIQKILACTTYAELSIYGKVMDRLVMASYYGIQGWFLDKIRIAFWNRVAHPEVMSEKDIDFTTWWSTEVESKK